LRDIADAWRLLEDVPAQVASSMLWRIAAGVLAAIAGIAIWAPWRGPSRIERPSTRLDFDLGPGISFGSTTGPSVILSPDGTRLVFVSQGADGVPRLFTRRLDDSKAVQMTGTEAAYAPFFSPDGQWVGFFAHGKLKKTRIDGGDPISLYDAPAARGGSW